MPPSLLLLLLLGLGGTLAAPVETPPTSSPFLEGIDEFLAAFSGLQLSGDPLAAFEPPPAVELQESIPPTEDIVAEVAPCLGCVEEVEVGSPELGRVARLAADLLEQQLNVTQVTEVTEVYRAARQVVNGIKYFLTLELTPTNCSLSLGNESDPCLVETEAAPLLYAVELLEHPQQELGAELLLFTEVSPEEVVGLPGLLSGSAPPSEAPAVEPPPPSDPALVPPEPLAGLEQQDLTALIADMERVFGTAEVPAAAEESTV